MNTGRSSLTLTVLVSVFHTALFAADNVSPAAAAVPVVSADKPVVKPKPKFQYKSEGIEVPAATAAEPKVKAFGPDSIRAARKYLDDGAHNWVREKSCIACHSTGTYMVDRPVLTPLLGKPSEEVLADFIENIPKPEAKSDISTIFSVWRSSGLAFWDKHVTGKLSAHTAVSLQRTMTCLEPEEVPLQGHLSLHHLHQHRTGPSRARALRRGAEAHRQLAMNRRDAGMPHSAWLPGDKFRVQHESALRTHAKEVHAKLPGIAKDFGRILDGAVWNYGPDHDVRHGDFIEDYRLVETLRSGIAPDYDVYDAATWSSIAVLGEKSVTDRSRPVDFPDFTKGKWKTTPPIKLMGV